MNLVSDPESLKLPDGVKLVNTAAHGIFGPEGNWYQRAFVVNTISMFLRTLGTRATPD